jgi:hypothetical protein
MLINICITIYVFKGPRYILGPGALHTLKNGSVRIHLITYYICII